MTFKPSPAVIALAAAGLLSASIALAASPAAPARPQMIQSSEIATPSAGPHEGKGPTVGHAFSNVAGMKDFYFSMRILKPGSSVGRHVMDSEEVYYLASGEAEFIDEVGPRPVKAGTAIFMRTGQTAELHQRGSVDAVLIVASPAQ